ncbi:uncharacterized protein LOC111268074 isoform X2 [Varroa jacobsoni]|uniref:uncharacterized protein LOC111268074 isoform X2 n=1 Tax=Varroa jacobsoni TaxID=62625 RepID=UPI000BF3DC1D|nr:uncharacterized protein LOC111268074 isoform X2 [Varroa jacobsoni]
MLFIISLTVSQLFPLAFPVHRLRVFLHCLLPLSLPLSIDLLMFYKHIVVFTGSNLFELDSSVTTLNDASSFVSGIHCRAIAGAYRAKGTVARKGKDVRRAFPPEPYRHAGLTAPVGMLKGWTELSPVVNERTRRDRGHGPRMSPDRLRGTARRGATRTREPSSCELPCAAEPSGPEIKPQCSNDSSSSSRKTRFWY